MSDRQIPDFAMMVDNMILALMPVRILVCGGRNYADKDKVFRTLDRLVSVSENNQLGHHCTIIQGGAKGADRLASDWATCNWKEEVVFKAEWDRFGQAAGYIRNRKMLKEGNPMFVVAFPGGRGTANMIEIAKDASVQVLEIE